MRKLAIHWQIILGLFFGSIWGITASEFGFSKFTIDWISPFGSIFINLLKLIAVPLVLVSLIVGVSSLKDLSSLSRMGSRTAIFYVFTTIIAITLGLGIVNLVKPGHSFSPEKREEFRRKFASNVEEKAASAQQIKKQGPLQFLVDMVPDNIFSSLQDNKKMLQVILFAILFGISLVMIPSEKGQIIKDFFIGINEVILKMVDIVMKLAPIGVFALIAGIIADFSGNITELFHALGMYSATVITGLLIMIVIVYPIMIKVFTKTKIIDFFRAILPAQMLAFSTSSSAATLPVTMDRCENELGVSEEVTSFVLPLGATINMDGTSLYQAVAAVFIAQAFGYDLTVMQQLTIVLMATLSSIGAAPVPGAGMVMLIIILQSVGINPEGLALIFAVDRILDMFRTVVNVTSDATVTLIIGNSEQKREQKLMSN